MRPLNAAIAMLASVTGSIVEMDSTYSCGTFLVILLSISTFMTFGGANVINDINDRGIDQINHPRRQISSGKLSEGKASASFISLWTLSVILAAFISFLIIDPLPIIILTFAMLLDLSYEVYFKRRGFIGNLTIGLLTGMIFIYGASIFEPGPFVISLAVLAFLSTTSREIIKDVEDLEGERSIRNTLPKRIGEARSLKIAFIFMMAAVSFSLLPPFFIGPDPIYVIFIALADIMLILGAINSFNDPKRGHLMIKSGMLIAVLGFLFSSLF